MATLNNWKTRSSSYTGPLYAAGVSALASDTHITNEGMVDGKQTTATILDRSV
jgi:hypothetical protein